MPRIAQTGPEPLTRMRYGVNSFKFKTALWQVVHSYNFKINRNIYMQGMTKQLVATKIAQFCLYYLIRTYSQTFRIKVVNEHTWLNYYLKDNGTVLMCTYHQQFFSAIRHFKKYKDYRPGLMISQSRDGNIIAAVAQRTGWHPVRGSSSKGGSEALKLMIEHLNKFRLAGHIVDGPRGPAGEVKAGIIRLAMEANAVIVPFYVTADRAWYFNSWDKFLLPKPFANVILKFGDMIKINASEDKQKFEAQRKSLELTMCQESERLKTNL